MSEEWTTVQTAALDDLYRVGELGRAWSEAEAALPEGWRFYGIEPGEVDELDPDQATWPTRWEAAATDASLLAGGWERVNAWRDGDLDAPDLDLIYGEEVDAAGPSDVFGAGPTPAAALRALAAKLRERMG